MKEPLVSCLTITRDRPEMLRRSTDQFLAQTWPNRELVIVVDPRSRHEEWLPEFEIWLDGHPDVSVHIGSETTVGGLRNESVKLAIGKLVATWDDDDYNHPRRLEMQIEHLMDLERYGTKACYLQAAGIHMVDEERFAICSFPMLGLAPTMVAHKDAMIEYPKLERASDSEVQTHFGRASQITMGPRECWLYARTYHGKNIWEREHFAKFIEANAFREAWLHEALPGLAKEIVHLYGNDEPPKRVTALGGKRMEIGS
jgi:glycosyltransferase involved in cell wall biosynthesis